MSQVSLPPATKVTTTSRVVAVAQSAIPYTYPGPLVASTSPDITPRLPLVITGLSVTLDTAGTTATVVNLLLNGTVLLTVTIAAGSQYAHQSLTTPRSMVARSDRYSIQIATVGNGAVNLGGEIEIN